MAGAAGLRQEGMTMEVLDVIRKRRSIRAYEDKPVPGEVLDRLIEAARIAPSAGGVEDWRFVIVTDGEMRKELAEAATPYGFVAEAPVVIAACGVGTDRIMKCGQAACPIDVAIAGEHIILQAVAEGLGTCWIGHFDEPKVASLLGIPAEARVVELITVGYPAEQRGPKNRKAMSEIACRETWSF